jgi:hypothetical protein
VLGRHRDDSIELSPDLEKRVGSIYLEKRVGSNTMHATIRRYEEIDQTHTSEHVKKAENSLLPRLSELRASTATT